MSTTDVILETGPESGNKHYAGTIRFHGLPGDNPGLANPVNAVPDDFSEPATALPFQFEWVTPPEESGQRLDELASRIGGDVSSGKDCGRDDAYEWRVK
ncbi:MAG: hypothetical protein JWM11_7121 [Planctomycetaceae bacterium]|nr:hypothetical protein [Planctomycetaceae bacterium]